MHAWAQACGAGEYVSEAGTEVADVTCTACGECGNDEYETAPCAAGGGRVAGSPRGCSTYTVCAPTYSRVRV